MRNGLLFLTMRWVLKQAALGIWIGWLSFGAGHAQSGSVEETEYYAHWIVAAAELTNVAVIVGTDDGPAGAGRARGLEDRSLRLDNALKRLLESMPPEADVERHLTVLPHFQECASAVRALAESARRGNALEFETARDWYVEALDRLRRAGRRFSSPLGRPG